MPRCFCDSQCICGHLPGFRPFWALLIHRFNSTTPITPVKTLRCGSLIRPVQGRETKLSDPQNIWDMHCGCNCLDITAGSASKQRCIVLNCLVKASQRVTRIARFRRFKSMLRSLTGSLHLASPEQSLRAKSVWSKGKDSLKLICATKRCCFISHYHLSKRIFARRCKSS